MTMAREQFSEAHGKIVHPPAEIAGDGAQRHADDEGSERRDEADHQ